MHGEGGRVRAAVHEQGTHGPQSTRRERTLSIPMSHTFMHSALISMQRPWKFSWSNTHIWIVGVKRMRMGVRKEVTEVVSKSSATPEESRKRMERLQGSDCVFMTAFSTVT